MTTPAGSFDERAVPTSTGGPPYSASQDGHQEEAIIRLEIARRIRYTNQRWEALTQLATGFADLEDVAGRAFIYVTGSMARGEATEGSDLDLFVVDCLAGSRSCPDLAGDCDHLDYVETAKLVAHLDRVREDGGFRRFSRGGDFIRTHHLSRIMELTGDPLDDAENAFTARILLLVNSRPLWNPTAYEGARERILDSYWKPQEPEALFRPIMLVNDLRRWWSVLCLNFERFYKPQIVDEYAAHSTSDRRVANLKLRYARLLAAYTPIFSLIDQSDERGLVTRDQARDVLKRSPIERLEKLVVSTRGDVGTLAASLLDRYDDYLQFMRLDDDAVKRAVADREQWARVKNEAYEFHSLVVSLYHAVGHHRLLYEYALI